MNGQENEKITLEWITQQKERKLKEIHDTKENIRFKTGQLLGPREKRKSGIEGLMKNFSTAFVIYDGIRIGLGIMRRLRSSFGLKK